jgi:uncharacterized membrane protein
LRVPDDRPAAPAVSPRVLLALAAIVLAGAGLRLHRLGAESLWIDEFYSLFASTGRHAVEFRLPRGVVLERSPRAPTAISPGSSVWQVPAAVNRNPHPPLFFVLLRAWRLAFGDGEIALRVLPVLASLAAIVLLFDVVRLLHDAATALWAAAFMAAAPLQVFYAREVRGYSLALALALAALAVVARIRLRGPRWSLVALLGTLVLLCALVHYFVLGVLAGLAGIVMVTLKGPARTRTLAAIAVAGAVFLAAWGPFFWAMHRRMAEGGFRGFHEGIDGLGARTALRAASAPWHHLTAHERHAPAALPQVAPSLVLAVIALGARREALPWALWLAGGVGLVAAHDLLSTSRQLQVVRFIYFASPATYVLLALAPRALGRRWGTLLPAAALVLACWTLPGVYALRNPPWRDMARAVEECLADTDVLALYATPDGIANTFWSLSHYGRLDGNAVLLLSSRLSPAAAARLARSPAVCLVTGAPTATGLAAQFPVAKLRWVAPGMASLWRLERLPSS